MNLVLIHFNNHVKSTPLQNNPDSRSLMSSFCGFDFGTSNSTIGICHEKKYSLVPLENNRPIIRSAIFCDAENKEWVFGQEGVNRYLSSIPGRLLMSLKSVLGSSLMDDETFIFNDFISYTKILSRFVHHIKTLAEKTNGDELTQVVLGRPVHFHDTDVNQDKQAEATLEKIAKEIGFKEVSFQFEPIAAALTYETTISKEQLALIIDMGGGTSDFTVIRLRPGVTSSHRTEDVLANAGIHIAGTDFDHKLSLNSVMPLLGLGSLMQGSSSAIEVPLMYYHDLTTWHSLASLYTPKTISHLKSMRAVAHEKHLIQRLIHVLENRAGHHILNVVETSKQQLSDVLEVLMDLHFIENHLAVTMQRAMLNEVIQEYLTQIIKTILNTVHLAGVTPHDISAIFYTGGSTKIPIIREQINPLFKNAEIIQGDAFGSVGLGLTIEAKKRYG